MNVRYESAFEKDLKNIRDKALLKRIKAIIEMIKEADSIEELSSVKKLKSYDTLYRIRLSDYRIGIEIADNEIIFVHWVRQGGIKKTTRTKEPSERIGCNRPQITGVMNDWQ